MTVRVKILAISAVLLVLFAAVLVGSVVMQKQSRSRVAAIIDVHLPLASAIADLDVATYEYELIVERLLRSARETPAVTDEDRSALARAGGDESRADSSAPASSSIARSSILGRMATIGSCSRRCSARSCTWAGSRRRS